MTAWCSANSFSCLLCSIMAVFISCQSQECGWPINGQHRQPRFRTSSGRIISGVESSDKAWPWQVSLELLHPNLGFVGHWCGAVLVHPQWLLSAAHCVQNEAFNLPLPALWTAVLGDWNRAVEEHYEERIPIAKIIMHEKFHNYQNDIVLMKLSTPANLTRRSRIRLVCLSDGPKTSNYFSSDLGSNTSKLIESIIAVMSKTEHSVNTNQDYAKYNETENKISYRQRALDNQPTRPGRKLHVPYTECIATGWGRSQESGELTDTLHQARVPVHENTLCRRMYAGMVAIRAGHLCAGNLDGSSGTCVGDSGGPLQCRMPDGRWYLAGITSFGSGCARTGFPDVYTRMSHYLPWVRANMNRADMEVT